MADPRTAEHFIGCLDPSTGCFASEPDLFEMMQLGPDAGIRSNDQSAVGGAIEAARDGLTFEEATFRPIRLDVEEASYVSESGDESTFNKGTLVADDNRRNIQALTDGSTLDRRRVRMARCAFQCASNPGCPIMMPPAEA